MNYKRDRQVMAEILKKHPKMSVGTFAHVVKIMKSLR